MAGLVGSLINWVRTFNIEGIPTTAEHFTDGVIISKVLNNIDQEFFDDGWLAKIKTDAGSNWRLKVSNLKKVLKGVLDYYNEILGQQITGFRMPDVTAIGEKNDSEELGRLLQLVLGIAVNCERKYEYIQAIMDLETDIQHHVMNSIQELMTKDIPAVDLQDTFTNLRDEVKNLTEDLHSTKESKEQITQRCHELDMQVAVLLEEKNNLLLENEKLLERLNHIESFEDPSTLAGKRFHQMQQKHELLQDELFKIETVRDELKGKVEVQRKEIIDLQQKNEELQKLAEESQAMKDELDVLRHISDKVNVYEATIESYKKKLEDMGDLKRQVKLLETKNTQYMQQCMEQEEELKKTLLMKSQIDMYKKQVQELQFNLSEETKRADKAEFETKRAHEKLSSIQQEKERLVIERDSLKESLEELRCMQLQKESASDNAGNEASISDNELLDAVPPEIREKLIRLQHENKMLKINEGATVDKQLTIVQSLLDDARSRINELETDNRLANRRIMELEGQIEDLHTNQSAVNIQEGSDLKQKLSSAMKRQKEADVEIQNYNVTIESLESQVEASVRKNQQLQDILNHKDEEIRAMEERYRKYLEKAKNVIKTLDPKKNPYSHLDIVSLKTQLLEKEKIIANLEKEADKARALQDMEDKLITTAFYNLGAQLQKRVAEERLTQARNNHTFLSRQRQVTTRWTNLNSQGSYS
ncbi:protein Hook homolog 3 isoform X2 [Parasteatoda tepidariorum]|uniref:protein Hook homolog 3 isoform X2 n=1 Tax=Parasteatoda tepidariorum TaxID=114398 RepID=UPI00077FC381|nr:protein Hook homolog 3 isoform X2 [Parasteatoda tepidariorum]